ncbi:MAG: hypothetical protein C0623_12490 [Desulfuromonas sp.]|nr:MAG: hypothetical protein C0623_12490 [Desulfuromonas sp.]
MDNLLRIKYIGPVLKSVWTWRLLRSTCLVLLVAMAAWGWHQHRIAGLEVRDPLMYTNLTNHLFWVWWIMGVVFIAMLFGRGWCAVCPLGWLNGLTSRLGFRLALPGWLRNFIPVTLVLIVLQLMIYFLAIHRYPDYTATLLALCIVLAAGIGLFFRERAFCTLLCPAGAVFGLYARIAPFQLRVVNRDVCGGCASQRCISEPTEWQQHRLGSTVVYRHRRLDGCPVNLVPSEIADSADCTLCLTCLQNCDKDNVKVGFRPWLSDLYSTGLRPGETFFFVALLGLLTANFSKVYVELRDLVYWLPEQTARMLGWQESGFYVLAVIWIALIMPLLLMLPGYLVYRFGQIRSTFQTGVEPQPGLPAPVEERFWKNLGRLALSYIPLILAAHAVLALVKINAKAGYLGLALSDPSGIKSFLAINVTQTVSAPGVLLPLDVLKWIILLVLLVGLLVSGVVSFKSSQRSDGTTDNAYFTASLVGVSLLFSIYLATVFEWLFVR